MTTPEQPNTPPLTRRRLREIRNTGLTPVIGADTDASDTDIAEDTFVVQRPVPEAQHDDQGSTPDVAETVTVPPAPASDASVDLGVSPLTRRQARQQERIRTASVPVITPEMEAQFAADKAAAESDAAVNTSRDEADHDAIVADVEDEAPHAGSDVAAVPVSARGDEDDEPLVLVPVPDSGTGERPVIAAEFGAELLSGETPKVELPPTFDQLISRETSTAGSVATPNALILSQTPSAGPLTGPIAATGEVLITGTYDLPEGLGSTGHAAGTADGKEVDSVLIDGELPAHSSPTPIAASAAISTVKTDGEIIRPPAAEKGSRLMVTLAITAGALTLALLGVLILAFVTGVFS